MTKLQQFCKKVASANGQAQIVSYSLWGVLLAGMFWDACPDHVPNPVLAAWGALSLACLPVAIWAPKKILQVLLVADMVLTTVIAAMYFAHDPEATTLVYKVQESGEFVQSSVSMVFSEIALVWMIAHSLYLANLIQRQILEAKRFTNGS